MLPEMDLLGPADLDYGVEESSSDESTSDEEYEEVWGQDDPVI